MKSKFQAIKRLAPLVAVGAMSGSAMAQSASEGADAIGTVTSSVAAYGTAGLALAGAVVAAVVAIKWLKKFVGRAS